jgi:hypothetical protein
VLLERPAIIGSPRVERLVANRWTPVRYEGSIRGSPSRKGLIYYLDRYLLLREGDEYVMPGSLSSDSFVQEGGSLEPGARYRLRFSYRPQFVADDLEKLAGSSIETLEGCEIRTPQIHVEAAGR